MCSPNKDLDLTNIANLTPEQREYLRAGAQSIIDEINGYRLVDDNFVLSNFRDVLKTKIEDYASKLQKTQELDAQRQYEQDQRDAKTGNGITLGKRVTYKGYNCVLRTINKNPSDSETCYYEGIVEIGSSWYDAGWDKNGNCILFNKEQSTGYDFYHYSLKVNNQEDAWVIQYSNGEIRVTKELPQYPKAHDINGIIVSITKVVIDNREGLKEPRTPVLPHHR